MEPGAGSRRQQRASSCRTWTLASPRSPRRWPTRRTTSTRRSTPSAADAIASGCGCARSATPSSTTRCSCSSTTARIRAGARSTAPARRRADGQPRHRRRAASVQNWGWQRNAYWLSDTGDVWFQNSGTHTDQGPGARRRRRDRSDRHQPVQLRHQPARAREQRQHHRPQAERAAAGDARFAESRQRSDRRQHRADADLERRRGDDLRRAASARPTRRRSVVGPGHRVVQSRHAVERYARTSGRSSRSNAAGPTTGPVWSFTTSAAPPPPPGTPGSPSPTDGSTGLGTAPTLTWTSTGASSYDVRFGTANPPPQVSANQTAASFTHADARQQHARTSGRSSAATRPARRRARSGRSRRPRAAGEHRDRHLRERYPDGKPPRIVVGRERFDVPRRAETGDDGHRLRRHQQRAGGAGRTTWT